MGLCYASFCLNEQLKKLLRHRPIGCADAAHRVTSGRRLIVSVKIEGKPLCQYRGTGVEVFPGIEVFP